MSVFDKMGLDEVPEKLFAWDIPECWECGRLMEVNWAEVYFMDNEPYGQIQMYCGHVHDHKDEEIHILIFARSSITDNSWLTSKSEPSISLSHTDSFKVIKESDIIRVEPLMDY